MNLEIYFNDKKINEDLNEIKQLRPACMLFCSEICLDIDKYIILERICFKYKSFINKIISLSINESIKNNFKGLLILLQEPKSITKMYLVDVSDHFNFCFPSVELLYLINCNFSDDFF